METNKKIIAGCLVGFILIASILTYVYKDVIFLHKMSITYPDGCIEKYENGDLITPECIEGRILKEQLNQENIMGNRSEFTNGFGLEMETWNNGQK